MSKHTRGPWKWDDGRVGLTGPRGQSILEDGEGIWDLIPHSEDKEVREANAKLIESAPDLYEKLSKLVEEARRVQSGENHDGLSVAWHEANQLLFQLGRATEKSS